MMNQNYFELFQLPVQYELDLNIVKLKYYKLQQQFHPDKQNDLQEKQRSSQYAAQINDAYQTLQCDLKRACYLLEIMGMPLELEKNIQLSSDFLMTQMDLRGELQDCDHDKLALKHFSSKIDLILKKEKSNLAFLCKKLPISEVELKVAIKEMLFYTKLKTESEQMLWHC